jgi:AcrR family transcriptional regulator
MKRASTKEKKLERRVAIIEHARTWISDRSFEEIRLADLARELGVVKGTLYLYFPTKQDLFASVLMEEMEAWWASLSAAPVGAMGTDLAVSLASRGLLLRLLSSLHMGIEPGLTPDGLRSLKAWFLGFAERAAADLEKRYRGLAGRGFPFLLGVYALAIGASQLAFPPENVRALIAREETLKPFRVNFGEFLAVAIDAFYKGARVQEGQGQGEHLPGPSS